jgi:general secretion pathway protein G
MKFLKKIFGLNGRLSRKSYFLLGVLPMVVFGFLVQMHFKSVIYWIVLLSLFVPIFILAFISAVKRGRDSGLNGLITLFLFGTVPLIVVMLNMQIEIDIFYIIFSFIAYLLLMPSSSKELNIIGKIEYVFTIIFMGLVFILWGSLISPKCLCVGEKAKIDLTRVNMMMTARVLLMFKLDNGVYPEKDEGFQALRVNPNTDKYTNYSADAYLKELPKDAWGGKMLYIKTEDGFDIISYGADKKEGGEDECADVFYSKRNK